MIAQGFDAKAQFLAQLTIRYCETGWPKTRANSNRYAIVTPAPNCQIRPKFDVEILAEIGALPAPFSAFRAYDQEVR